MSLPIKDTPILSGKDAKIFEKNIKKNENKKISKKELKIIEENYKKLASISKDK